MKGIIALLFLLGGITTVIYRVLSNAKNKRNALKLFAKAESDKAFAETLCDDLSIFYGKTLYRNSFQFSSFKPEILNNVFGQYKILNILDVNGRLLLLAQCSYVDWGTNWQGKADDVKKGFYQFFMLTNDTKEKCVSIYSTAFLTNEQKFLIQDFVKAMLEKVA